MTRLLFNTIETMVPIHYRIFNTISFALLDHSLTMVLFVASKISLLFNIFHYSNSRNLTLKKLMRRITVTGIDPIMLDTRTELVAAALKPGRGVKRVLGLLKLPGQETQLGVLGTPRLVLYTTSMEGYGTYRNMAEWGVINGESSRTRWKQTETTRENYTNRDTTSFCRGRFTHDSYSYGHAHPCWLLMPEWAVTITIWNNSHRMGVPQCM